MKIFQTSIKGSFLECQIYFSIILLLYVTMIWIIPSLSLINTTFIIKRVSIHQPSKVSLHMLPPLFIVLSQTSVIQSGSLIKSCGSLGAWHSTDDSILLNITSPLFGFPFHLENTTDYYQPHFQTEQIKITINQPAGPATTSLCRVSSLAQFICSPSSL